MMPLKKTIKIVLLTIISLTFVVSLGGGLFIYSGVYNIAATTPHFQTTIMLITWMKKRAVQNYASELKSPDLSQKKLIQNGFKLYQQKCFFCHGGPGSIPNDVVRGLNPNPPPLEQSIEHWSKEEIAWIIAHGLKMTGMPGFKLRQDSQELWSLTAFVKRINTLEPSQYRKMLDFEKGQISAEEVQWLPSPQGWRELAQRGDPNRGQKDFHSFGCVQCHSHNGTVAQNANAGPPLSNWEERHYIVGEMINNPNNLVEWMLNPGHIKTQTFMPNVGLNESEAWNIARFLLDKSPKLKRLNHE